MWLPTDFASDRVRLGAGGIGTLFLKLRESSSGRIDNTNALLFSADEGADVGVDEGTPVTEDYESADTHFTGQINQVTIDLTPIGADIKDKVDKATEQLIFDKDAED